MLACFSRFVAGATKREDHGGGDHARISRIIKFLRERHKRRTHTNTGGRRPQPQASVSDDDAFNAARECLDEVTRARVRDFFP